MVVVYPPENYFVGPLVRAYFRKVGHEVPHDVEVRASMRRTNRVFPLVEKTVCDLEVVEVAERFLKRLYGESISLVPYDDSCANELLQRAFYL